MQDDRTKTVLERAFDLARSGRFATANDIKRRLAAEGYSTAQFTGLSLTRQLREAIQSVKASSPGRLASE